MYLNNCNCIHYRTKRSLPKSPRKKLKVIQKLVTIKRQRLTNETAKEVEEFFLREDVSRWTPGRKEYVKVGREKKQKRYMNMTLKEAFSIYQEEDHAESVKFSKFCELRPQEVTMGKLLWRSAAA